MCRHILLCIAIAKMHPDACVYLLCRRPDHFRTAGKHCCALHTHIFLDVCRESYEECRSKALEDVVTAVVAAPIPLAGSPWLPLSPLGMDFLSGLLTRDSSERLTGSEALEHPWFREQLGWHDDGGADEVGMTGEVNNILPLGQKQKHPQCSLYRSTSQLLEEAVSQR